MSEDAAPVPDRSPGLAADLRAARRGDAEAFARLYRPHAADVDRLCRRLLGAGPDAEDAVSESFLRAAAAVEGFDPARPLRPWLLAVAAHHCVDRLRRRSVEGRLFRPEDLEAGAPGDEGAGPLRALLLSEDRRRLHAALADLPPRDRVPLLLRYFADLSYEAMAEILGVSRPQVGTLLYRARLRLRARYLIGEDEP